MKSLLSNTLLTALRVDGFKSSSAFFFWTVLHRAMNVSDTKYQTGVLSLCSHGKEECFRNVTLARKYFVSVASCLRNKLPTSV